MHQRKKENKQKLKNIRGYTRKAIISCLSFFISLSMFNLTALASYTADITVSDPVGYGYSVSDSDGSSTYSATMDRIYIDGQIGFCIQPGKLLVPGTGTSYELPLSQSTMLGIIQYQGYGNTSQTNEDYMATQLYIWEYMGGTVKSTTLSDYATRRAQISERIAHHNDKPSFDGESYEVNVGESLRIHDDNGVLSQFHSVNTGNTSITIDGNDLVITPNADSDNIASLGLKKVPDKFVGTPMAFSNGSQNVALLPVGDPVFVRLSVKVNKVGHLNITKLNEDGAKVANTSFSLSKNANMSDPIGTYTTGASGEVLVSDILGGTYYIQETAVPEPLILDSTIHSVTIEANKTTEFSATNNYKKGVIEIQKLDLENGLAVEQAGIVFEVYKKDGTLVNTITTNDKGIATLGALRYGEYYFKEIKAPVGFLLNSTHVPFSVIENGVTIKKSISNQPIKGKVEIQKMDVETKKAVNKAGAEFKIYKKDGTFVNTVSTNDKGIASLGDLRYGDYYFVESKAPSGYVLNTTPVNFSIREHGVTVKTLISNMRTLGTVELTKVDGETTVAQGDATLDGAIYKLYAKENILSPDDGHVVIKKDAEVSTLTIKDGKAKVENLYLGKYYIKEVTASKGYLLDKTAHDINLNYTNQNKAVEIRAASSAEIVKKQAFSIIKIGSNGDSGETPTLKGAEFTVKLASEVKEKGWNNAKTYDVITTDDKGYALSKELPFGTYTVRETKTPAEHEKINDFTVKITTDSREPQVWRVFNDVPFESLIAIIKVDQETGDVVRIAGAKFKIKNLDTGDYVGHWSWNPLPHYVDVFETTEDGTVMTADQVLFGHYQLEEIESPEGYLLSKEPVKFEISNKDAHETGPDGTTIITNVKFSDVPVKGQLSIQKEAELFKGYDFVETEYGKLYSPIYERGLLAGVKFEIKAREDITSPDGTRLIYKKGKIIETITTDGVNLTKSSLLPLGKYTYQEVETAEGYVLDETVYEFDLVYKDQETAVVKQTVKMDNEKQGAISAVLKGIEDSEMNNNSEAYKDVKFAVKTAEETDHLEADSMVGLTGVSDELIGNITLTQAGNYYMQEVATNGQYVLDDTKYPFIFGYNGDVTQTIEINDGDPIYNYVKRGRLEILKSDELTANPMVNVWYQLATDETFENIIKETSTDETGRAIFEELEKGTYYVRERYDNNHDMVLEGYVKDPTVHKVVVEDNEQLLTLELSNQPVRGKASFTKTGESFNNVEIVEGDFGTEYHPVWSQGALLGSELTIYADEDITTWDGTQWYKKDDAAITLESDWDTTESITLPVGKYYAKETKVPHGYIADETIYEFEITKNGLAEIQLNPISINNERAKANINLTKAVEEQSVFINTEAYQDVVFGLFTREGIYDYMGGVAIEPGSLIGTSHIDEAGKLVEVYDLPNGTYYFKELATNDQYVLDPNEYDFEIGYQGSDTKEYTIDINKGDTIHNLLKRGSLELMKQDAESEKPLLNVWYQLATDETFENIIKETSTDETGRAIFEELERGTYYLRERYNDEFDMVMEGYVKDPTIHKVIVEDNEQLISLEFENQPVKGNVSFTKTGESFNDVEIIEGDYGSEYHPIWSQGSLLGSELTVYAAEDITTWDSTKWYKEDEEVLTLESDWETVESALLPVGKYYAKETKVPHGYIGDETIYEFEITPNGSAEVQLNPISIDNQRAKVNIDFRKTMENQETFMNPDAYQDVVFGLFAREGIYDYMGGVAIEPGSLIGTSHIDESGKLIETYDLPNGTYFFKELATNEQYNLSDVEYNFEIGYQGSDVKEYTIELNDGKAIENTLIRGTIEVIKSSKEDKAFYSKSEQTMFNAIERKDTDQLRNIKSPTEITYLTGVSFELATDKEFKNIIKKGVTDLDGRLVFDNLERGIYFVREDKALDFYVLDPTVHEITIDKNGQFETIDVDNNLIESYVDIKKVDFYDESKTLPFAGFTMYSDEACTEEIRTIKTDKSGIAHFDGIKFGSTVYLKETSAPTGYELSDKVIKVTIDEEWINGGKDTRIIVFPDQPIEVIQVVTGDDAQTMFYISLFILSAGLVSLMIKRRIKENN